MFLKSRLYISTPERDFETHNRVLNNGFEYFFNCIFNNTPIANLLMGLIDNDNYVSIYNFSSMGLFKPWDYRFNTDRIITSDYINFILPATKDVRGIFLCPSNDLTIKYTAVVFDNYIKTNTISVKYEIYC